jgi:23S rRNA (guanosine2251-2'-O)-methyltransferase
MSLGGNHQGVVAMLEGIPAARVQDLLQPMPGRAQPPLLLAADQVEDVGNLGSLIRTLEACGGAGVIVPERRSAALAGGLARASAGASLRTAIVSVGNLARTLASLKTAGVQIVGLDAGSDTAFDALTYDAPCCVVVGSESRGMRDSVRNACYAVVRVPMRGSIGSLNVAAAGAIVLHHIGRQRVESGL